MRFDLIEFNRMRLGGKIGSSQVVGLVLLGFRLTKAKQSKQRELSKVCGETNNEISV